MITPDQLVRHELIGLPVRVADADSDAHVGIAGRVLSETFGTLVVRTRSGDKRVPKSGATFEFGIVDVPTARTDEAAGDGQSSGSTSQLGSDTTGVRPRQSGPSGSTSAVDSDGAGPASRRGECKDVVYVTVDGTRLRHRPAERTEQGVTQWR
ncbi:ribonuclease P protein component 1 [Halorubrum aidingense JCM 13560]|uniref:Ribonuclease P protein component 1 n=1 Tax=Halorubrum aidingense JCM 13560 TaxID=1230454 RepID=M0PCV4_9EURY|nr:ribonuclease P protein component 1 [Halorubrum aidingense]EMA66660.1 ribonuclease P protein component 1 [Halorubrum aidingense JCM 13560]